ncbi:MAG: AAA family ATPase [Anaerolineae bacterium]|nr:AAA family ATPase [Anaerolineae bacterium]
MSLPAVFRQALAQYQSSSAEARLRQGEDERQNTRQPSLDDWTTLPFERHAFEASLHLAEEKRRDILRAFPLDGWATLPLERYALGLDVSEPTFCHWLEYKSKVLGGMGGGTANKLVIYKQKDGTWFYPRQFADVEAAWVALRAAYGQAFANARDNRWAEMDAIALLREKGVLLKALHIYFPSRILPIVSRAHLQHFLRAFAVDLTSVRDYGRVQLNRALLHAIQQHPEFDGWTTNEIALFLYHACPPSQAEVEAQSGAQAGTLKEPKATYQAGASASEKSAQPRYWKISPGEGAWQWRDCVRGGFIAIGWDELGDVRQVERDEFERRMTALIEREPEHFAKGGMEQVWKFRNIQIGDRVVANRGKSLVLGIGTVTGAYYYQTQANTHRHRLAVRWDDQIERVVQQAGWQRTLIEIDAELFETLLLWPSAEAEALDEDAAMLDGADDEARLQAEYSLDMCAADTHIPSDTLAQWKSALERKRQAIFYGPPGTGKTFLAQALAKHLVGGGNGLVDMVQFHPAYAYEDFVQGIRPRSHHGALDYPLTDGAFVRFCKRASKRSGTCVMIVDEINRANLSRVFGELMYLLEYREKAITLASGEAFSIPDNVLLIGTMNTADRSIALVDHALRRRFAFISLQPNYEVLRQYHRPFAAGFDPAGLIAVLQRLNRQINNPHFALGVSFFLRPELRHEIESIWRSEIEPYLEEYFFDQPDRLDDFRWERVRGEIV